MVIDKFRGKYEFLSNFYPCPVIYNGMRFPAAEEAFQSAKTTDISTKRLFTVTASCNDAKQLGRQIGLRSDWDQIKDSVMYDVIHAKFENPKLKKLLLDTGDAELIEGNSWGDTYWGVCRGEGQNKLGKILMQVRKDLREDE